MADVRAPGWGDHIGVEINLVRQNPSVFWRPAREYRGGPQLKKSVSALLIAATAGILPAAAASATTTTTVTTAITTLKSAEAKLGTVLGSYAPTPTWKAQYHAAEAAVNGAQAALTQALAAATPAAPVAWQKVGTTTVTGTYEEGVNYSGTDVRTPGYYTGDFRATVSLSAAPPKSAYYEDEVPTLYWSVECVGAYGLGSGSNDGTVKVAGASGSAIMAIPAHMRDCYASAGYEAYGTGSTADAGRTFSATVSLYASGKFVGTTG
jgi:hypothetical protein